MQQRKVVSVSFELDSLEAVLDGARILLDAMRNDGDRGEDDTRATAAAVSGIVSLVGTRVRDLAATMRGHLEVETFWAGHNSGAYVEGEDVLLSVKAKKR